MNKIGNLVTMCVIQANNSDLINNKSSSSETSSGSGSNPGNQGDTLADLANSEISLDLQGLIDDAHFGADAENLFGDLIDNGQNTVSHFLISLL